MNGAQIEFLEQVQRYCYSKDEIEAEKLIAASRAVLGSADKVPWDFLHDVSEAAGHPRWAEVSFVYAAKKIIAALDKPKV